MDAPLEAFHSDSAPNSQKIKAWTPLREGVKDERNGELIAFQRTVSDHVVEIQPTDVATIEASIHGFFDRPLDLVKEAWQETLRMQEDNEINSSEDPRQIALALFASRFNYNIARSTEGQIHDVLSKRLVSALYD